MTTQEITGYVASIAIATDLAMHVMHFGIPRVWELGSYTTADGLRNVGTLTGVVATATTSGVASEELKGIIDAMPDATDRMVARAAVASSFLSSKTIAQTGVVLAYSLIVPNGWAEMSDYTAKQLAPSLMINAITAFAIPYAFSK
jgi:hypothetical protein